MPFQFHRLLVYQRMSEYNRAAAPLIARLKVKDRNLAGQIERNGNSMVSNLGEGASEDRPKMKANSYRISKRETEESAANWEKTIDSGHFQRADVDSLLNKLDEIARMLFGLIKRFDP